MPQPVPFQDARLVAAIPISEGAGEVVGASDEQRFLIGTIIYYDKYRVQPGRGFLKDGEWKTLHIIKEWNALRSDI